MTERRSRVGGWPIAIIGMVLVLIAYELRYTLIPFVFAIVIAFVLEPIMTWATGKLGGRRWPMGMLLTIAIVGGAGFAAYWVGSTAIADLHSVISRLPQMIQAAVKAVAGPQGIDIFGTHYTPQQMSQLVITGVSNMISSTQIMLAVTIGAGTIAAVILTFVLIPYFLISGPRLAEGAIWLIPPERRGSVREMLPKLVPMLRRYVVGIICVVVYTAIVAFIGFGPIFHLPGSGLLAIVVGCLEMIPVIGPISSIVLVALTGVQKGGYTVAFVIAYAIGLRLSIDNLVGPIALGKSVTVHPVVVIFAFIIGAMLFGIIGLLLAVPTAAAIVLVLGHYYAEPIAPGGDTDPEAVRIGGREIRSR